MVTVREGALTAGPGAGLKPDAESTRNLRRPTMLGLLWATTLLVACGAPVVTMRSGPAPVPVRDVGPYSLTVTPNSWLIVDAQVGSEHGAFLVDTGAATSLVDLRIVEHAGATVLQCRSTYGVLGRLCSVALPALAFGPYFRSAALGGGADLSTSEVGGFGISGVIGADVLSQFSVVLDYPRGRWALIPPDQFTPPTGVPAIPMQSPASGLVTIPVTVDGEHQQFVLDTGASGAAGLVLEPRGSALAALTAPGALEYPGAIPAGDGSKATVVATHGKLCAGDLCWEHAPLMVANPTTTTGPLKAFQGILGPMYLRHFRVSIDYPRQLLYLEQEMPFERDADAWSLGWAVLPKQGRLEVQSVAPGGPAALAGVHVGDTIRSVEGITTEGHGDVLAYLLDGPRTAAALTLDVESDGKVRTVRLSPRPVP